MNPHPIRQPANEFRSAHVEQDALVLVGRPLRPGAGVGPRFGDDIWDLSAAHHAPNTHLSGLRIRFDRIGDRFWRITAKEYAAARLTTPVDRGGQGLPSVATVAREIRILRVLFTYLAEYHPGLRLADIDDDMVLDRFVIIATAGSTKWQPHERARHAWLLTLLHRSGDQLTFDRLTRIPFQGRTARQISGRRNNRDNATPRIPPQVLAPYLRGALFYVQTASRDILAAVEERKRLDNSFIPSQRGEISQRLELFLRQRRNEGRGLPAAPANVVTRFGEQINLALIARMIGVRKEALKCASHRRRILTAAAELGLEPGGMDSPISLDPDTAAPWRDRFDLPDLHIECRHLLAAAYVVTAYLSGMRDSEVQALRRGCHFTENTEDRILLRHKLRGTVYKGRKATGEAATWVVTEPVARAVAILEQLTDSEYLFTRFSHNRDQIDSLPAQEINVWLNAFRDRLAAVRPHDPIPEVDGRQWRFTTRQFRRTVAWHIARQPFGAVAGKIQYQHVRVAIFEGYAGTSASGFPSEIDAEREFARLDSILDQYEDYKAGVRTPARLIEQFDHIRAELGDFPGRIADTSRLRAMLANTARTYHPGVLNDCYFDPAAALCQRHHRADSPESAGPIINHCQSALCRNSCVTTRHEPAIRQVIADAEQLLAIQRLSPIQRAALHNQIATMAALLPVEGGFA
ncbi:hypothetical protein ACFXG4_23870 [Nocardia sp. NPDC059246]|uniref:hypothetical protein n=1 Tax=unclassified Nocardia TaxID=2637762 RepID=UPI0036CB90D0